MTADMHQQNRKRIGRFREALYNCGQCGQSSLVAAMQDIFAPHCTIHLAFPFEDMDGPTELFDKAYLPLIEALPDLERRDYIVMAGPAATGNWVGCAGYYTGVFEHRWLDIPPTQRPAALRFHEFFRMEQGRIVEMQALWDIPQLMMQAGVWPMVPSLGVEWLVPGPATADGIITAPYDQKRSEASLHLVRSMLDGLSRYADGGHQAMNLEKFWHPAMSWYGPAGIGSNRRVTGFRNHHQIPFLNGMPDREGGRGPDMSLFSDGDYVGFTAWPGMRARISGDGWLGIAPSGQEITMRSLDFWRCENGLIRENWVLVDLLDVYNQIGVNVFNRMREITGHRPAAV